MRFQIANTVRRPQPANPVYASGRLAWIGPAWLRACILGSVIAMTISASVAVVVNYYLAEYRSGAPRVAAVELMALAAALEGALIAYFQWRVLRRVFPTMTSGPWVGSSMLAAAFGCLISCLPTSFALTAALAGSIGDVTPEPYEIARFSLVTGALIGLVWGAAQFAVLRMHVHRAGLWILASIASWTVSFAWLYFAAFLPDRTMSPIIHIALGALAGLILGSVLGLVQGRVLAGLESRLLVEGSPGRELPSDEEQLAKRKYHAHLQ